MRVVIIKEDGSTIEVAIGTEVEVDGIVVSAKEKKEVEFYDPATLFPGVSGGGAGSD